ncbi:MAG: Crp/Fnr family transcriptional regulator [Epsilonproteobacteria bacterium]|nr:Crp/Fnr family transcriptional regulator [Campylobacterota bacterium]
MQELKEYINHFIHLDDEEWESLSLLFTKVHYKKGEHIYGDSEVSQSLYFILDGIVRSYKLEEDGRDFTWTFHCLNMDSLSHRMLMDIAVVDYVSFTQNIPEVLAFEALSDTTLVKINKQDLLSLYDSSQKWQKFATKMAEDSYAIMRERTFNLLTKNAKERLDLLVHYFPGVFKKDVQVEHIASYLGITRQSLNRLRRQK